MIARTQKKPRCNGQAGFSLLEALISAVVLTIGLLAVCATLALALSSTQNVQLDTIARQRATQALESIYTARQMATITFDQIENVSGTGTGIFTKGFVSLTDPGPDGIEGTTDDVPVTAITIPGPSGTITGSTPPDVSVNLSNFQRSILISDVVTGGTTNPNLRQIQITIKYPTPAGFDRSYTVNAMISSYR
ncbi:MAG TPA: prepilin-type N-terminal cleavage/methylation domain-containing protein [Terriglobales bacterium]|nr:prepilin-type N-terminal cleavage/methylation domain-containing protein [Terriglobales bacterium]